MASLQPKGDLKKIMLPSSASEPVEDDKGWCVIELGAITAGDMLKLKNFGENVAPLEMQFPILVNRIKEWNLKDSTGEVAFITEDNVKRMDVADLALLMETLYSEDSNSTSPLVPTTSEA